MKKIHNILLFFCLVLSLSFSVFGKTNQTVLPNKPWKVTARFGMVNNTGNVSTSNIMGHVKFSYKKNKLLLNLSGGARFSSDKEEKTGESYNVKGGAEYYFYSRNFGFSELDHKYDKFSPYLYITTLVAGYGWKAIDNKKVTLILRAGPGLRRQKEAKKENAAAQEADNDLIGYGSAHLIWKITENAKFTQKASLDAGPKGGNIQSKTALLTKIIGNLGMELSFTIHHYTKIPKFSENAHKTDTRTQLAFVYSF